MSTKKDPTEQKIHDSLQSIIAVKGEKYADIVAWLIGALHLQNMVKQLATKFDDEKIDYVVGKQMSAVLAHGMAMIIEPLDFKTEDECREIMDWAERLVQYHYEDFIKENK
jgi:hypothetical protein